MDETDKNNIKPEIEFMPKAIPDPDLPQEQEYVFDDGKSFKSSMLRNNKMFLIVLGLLLLIGIFGVMIALVSIADLLGLSRADQSSFDINNKIYESEKRYTSSDSRC